VTTSRTLYFIANDRMYDFTVAFLNSLRAYNPASPLCLIPYDSDVDRVLTLQSDYAFSVWSDDQVLARCDDISRQFHGRVLGQYRKLAMWEGPCDEFLYVDTDTVVLRSLAFVFSLLSDVAFLTSHSDMEGLEQWVWKPTIRASGALTELQIRFSANTGFIASHRGLLTLDYAEAFLADALELAPHMELMCAEQPLLNYLFVTSGLRFDSLAAIVHRTGQTEIPRERWAGSNSMSVSHGEVTSPRVPPTLLVHWAGLWNRLEQGTLPYMELWKFYRDLRVG
jgi:hypothetical protein